MENQLEMAITGIGFSFRRVFFKLRLPALLILLHLLPIQIQNACYFFNQNMQSHACRLNRTRITNKIIRRIILLILVFYFIFYFTYFVFFFCQFSLAELLYHHYPLEYC